MEKLRIVIGGFIGLYPTGGVTWDYIQYVLGLHLLGHDVFYIEDTMQYSKFQSAGKAWNDASDSVQYLKVTMEKFGLSSRWAYRDVASGDCFGLPISKVLEICRTADLFINVSSATHIQKDEYVNIPKKVLIDSDPMFTQVQYWNDENPESSYDEIKTLYSFYDYLFSFGENIGKDDCKIPTFDLKWIPTRQPICIDYWKSSMSINLFGAFTTVMNWSTRNKMQYKNEEWGQKDVEFKKIIQIPALCKEVDFKIIVARSSNTSTNFNKERLENNGWKILEPTSKINNVKGYQDFIQSSLGEFSVAKESYVKSNSGWFSCRSACYLATGKPVITQETMWSKYIPSGEGLFAFTDVHSALDSLHHVIINLEKHSKASKELASEYFDSKKVLMNMLLQIN